VAPIRLQALAFTSLSPIGVIGRSWPLGKQAWRLFFAITDPRKALADSDYRVSRQVGDHEIGAAATRKLGDSDL
jgi:hypothetical protein